MQLIVSSIVTSIVNLIVFSLIPFVWWFFRHRKETGFFSWIGFCKPKLKSRWPVLVIFALFLLAGLDVGLWYHTPMFLFTGAGNFISSMLVAFG